MLTAMLYPEAEPGGRGRNAEARKATAAAGLSAGRLTYARKVLKHSRKIAGAGGRGKTSDAGNRALSAGFGKSRLSIARAMLKYSRELAGRRQEVFESQPGGVQKWVG
jgi:hypothetical protein